MGGATGTTLSGIFENSEISVLIRWLQSNGTIKLLAEPQIVCISGTGASILAGGEFAVPDHHRSWWWSGNVIPRLRNEPGRNADCHGSRSDPTCRWFLNSAN
jgi:hypothetical protein